MREIIINNVRDVGIFTILSNTVFEDVLEQLLLAIAIVLINSVIIPLLKYIIKYVKSKYGTTPEIDKILDEFEKLSIEEIIKVEEKIKEKIKEEDEEE